MDEIQLERRIAAQYKRSKVLNERATNGHQDFTFETSWSLWEVWFGESQSGRPWVAARVAEYGDGSDDNRYEDISNHATLTNALEWLSAFA